MRTARDTHRTASVVRVALVASLVTGVLCAVAGGLLAGVPGLWGALLGTALVVVFFALGHVVLTTLRDIHPSTYLLIALLTYALQVMCLLALFGSFAQWADGVSAPALGLTIIACTLAWTWGLVAASRRQRIPLFDLGEGA